MQMAEARAVIGDAVSAAIAESFARDLQERDDCAPSLPRFAGGEFAPGHDASRVPPVPRAQLRIDRDSSTPGVIFTWKVESGDPPYVIADVPPHWLRDVVRPGYAVIDRHMVLQVLSRDNEGRPSQVLAMVVGGHFDAAMHGWRADGAAVACDVEWADGTPAIVLPQGTRWDLG
jgi:hypothetical protein